MSGLLDTAITATMHRAGIPGVIAGLWIPGKGSYIRAFGVADKGTGAPMSDRLHMRIGSVTKSFTVTAVLELVDRGRVRLDDPVSRYVKGRPPGRPDSNVYDLPPEPSASASPTG